jgi:5-methyltetrahydropteroyltriglutamate--homocysteine methyltransferase
MEPVVEHQFTAKTSFNGGDLDCGNGLLFLIRKHLDPLNSGELLEILSTETSVEEELPAWCRLTHNQLVSWTKHGNQRSFLICKGDFAVKKDEWATTASPPDDLGVQTPHISTSNSKTQPSVLDTTELSAYAPTALVEIPPLACMGIGSWPRPTWLLSALHKYLEGMLPEEEFQALASRAVLLAVEAQTSAGADVLSDGEQRRNNYASFVGKRLENCELVPLRDLLPLVDDPESFEKEMLALDVPPDKVRHPAIVGRLARKRPLVLHEYQFTRTITNAPIKVALPGPYLLTRLMWLACTSEKIYASRDELAEDIVAILHSEVNELITNGVRLVQLDEPILTEVVFSGKTKSRSFMCGALSERGDTPSELEFAKYLINKVVDGMPRAKVAIHICRGNWTPDESVALVGGYEPLLGILQGLKVGTMLLEFCTPRAGDMEILKEIPSAVQVGIGVVNPKDPHIETLDQVLAKVRDAIKLVGEERIVLTPDCGFATFADNPTASPEIAQAKLAVIKKAQAVLLGR